MKKFLVITLVLFTGIGLYAQPPRGEGGGGGRRPGGPPPGDMRQQRPGGEDKIILEFFPEIPDLTLQQREKVGTILTSERKDIRKQTEKKMELGRLDTMSEQDREKNKKKLDKIDKKISEITEKSNKKIGKVLNDNQYHVFLEKREDFKFRGNRERPHFQKEDGERRRPDHEFPDEKE